MPLRLGSSESRSPRSEAGTAWLAFRRRSDRTVLTRALAFSPLRVLLPHNHGESAWVFLASFGGGLVDGDRLETHVEVEPGASALIATQASTKVYRSPGGCSQHLHAHVDVGGALSVIPDPVVCFAGATYAQTVDIVLAEEASVFLLDAYTCGRSARGERWAFARYASRTRIRRGHDEVLVDAIRLEAQEGSIAERMGRFDVVVSLVAIGPGFGRVRDAMLDSAVRSHEDGAILAASPIGADGALVRVAARRYQTASRLMRPSFAALAGILGDDPFGRGR